MKTAGDAVDFESGAGPGALENTIAGFAYQLLRSYFVETVFFFVEGEALPGGQFFRAGRDDVVVEAGDEDVAIFVLQLASI